MTTTDVAMFPGIEIETLEGFVTAMTNSPNDFILGLEAKTVWEGHAGKSLGRIGPWELAGNRIEKESRDFSIQFGAWKEVEDAFGVVGAHDRVEPVEVALAAMCGCVLWAICINSAREDVRFETLRVRAAIKVDPRVLFGILPIEDATSCLQNVDLQIDVTGDEVTEETRRKIAEMANRSPVHSMIKYANTMTTTVNAN